MTLFYQNLLNDLLPQLDKDQNIFAKQSTILFDAVAIGIQEKPGCILLHPKPAGGIELRSYWLLYFFSDDSAEEVANSSTLPAVLYKTKFFYWNDVANFVKKVTADGFTMESFLKHSD